MPLDQFCPDATPLDVPELIAAVDPDDPCRSAFWGTPPTDEPLIGMYGKIGATKGTYELLRALRILIDAGVRTKLLMMSHHDLGDDEFRRIATELGLHGHVFQIPFLPNWRVPEFIRRCEIVCCLENRFPIPHAPIVAAEVMACGVCLVGSEEVLAKQPSSSLYWTDLMRSRTKPPGRRR